MADLIDLYADKNFTLQWHLTSRCQQCCKHCYVFDKATYEREKKKELSFETNKKIIDDFVDFCNHMHVRGEIAFTGGDPMLRDDLFDLLDYTYSKKLIIHVLGNPFLIDDDMAEKLRQHHVSRYQVSLDGLKDKHDYLRKPGSYDATISAIKTLKKHNIQVGVMFTLSKFNKDDLLPLMDVVADLNITAFSFARICGVGNGAGLVHEIITPQEYKELLIQYDDKAAELYEKGTKTYFGRKDHLFKLLDYDKGSLVPAGDKNMIYAGCTMGITGIIVLADGTVMACRRFPSPVGKVPEEKLLDIFLKSEKLNEYRNVHALEKCSKCELLRFCRGCPAVAYGQYGDWRKADPQCWKEI